MAERLKRVSLSNFAFMGKYSGGEVRLIFRNAHLQSFYFRFEMPATIADIKLFSRKVNIQL